MGVTAIPPERPLMIWHPADTPPAGYIKANAPTVSRTAYAWLFTIIGTKYGAGDGVTTFVAGPDMRGEFPRGWDDGRGVDPGRVNGSGQADMFKAHNHAQTNAGSGQWSYYATGSFGNQTTTYTQNTGGTETRPRNVAGLYCIAIAP